MKKPDWVRPSLDEASDRVLLLLIGQSTWLTERVIAERLRYRDGEVRTAMVRLVRDGYAAPHGRIHGTGELTYEHTFEGAEFMQAGGYREQNMLPRPQTAILQTQPEIGMAYGDYTREQMIMHLLKHIEHHPFNGLGIDSRNVRNSLALKMKIEQFEPALLWAETHDVVRRTKEGDIVPGKEGYAILKAGSIDAWEQARTQPGAGLWVGTIDPARLRLDPEAAEC